jgi:ABC-type nitrate/sulfonate/bicarbonate transport system permease component
MSEAGSQPAILPPPPTHWQLFRAWLVGQSATAGLTRVFVSFGSLLLLWEVLARTVLTNRLVIVPFSEVMVALVREVTTGQFWEHTRITFLELGIAFPISVLLGVALGLVLATSRLLQQILDPLLTAMYSVPIVALAPLFIAWLGFGIESKIAVILLVAVFPVIISTEVGLRSTDRSLIEAARSFNATGGQVFLTVTLPFAIPFIIGGIRVAFARALVGVVVAEFFGAFAGYGYAILAAGQSYQTAQLLAYVVILALLGMASSVLLRTWEKRLAPWRETHE